MPTESRIARMMKHIGCVALIVGLVAPQGVYGQQRKVDPQAEAIFKNSTDYLANLKQFGVKADSTIELVLDSGQKIQFGHGAKLSLRRPNKLRAERVGDLVDQVFYYDGTSLALHNPIENYYAILPAPDSLEGMLDFARESLDIVAPAGDLLYRNAFDIFMADVTSGFVVGQSMVAGVVCDHLAFRGPGVDWQIWIEAGERPLPRKVVITTTDVVGAPQFSVVMTKWDLEAGFGDDIFDFSPPNDGKSIEFILIGESAASSTK